MSSHHMPVFALVLAMLLWASSLVALKIAFVAYDPMVVIFGRMLVASLCFALCLPLFRGVRLRRSDLKYLLIMAIFEPCLYFIFEAWALENTTASQAGMITATLPLLVALFARPVLGERLEPKTLLGFFIAIAGALWLSLASDTSQSAPNPALGNLLEFLAMICAAGYTLCLKKLSSSYPPLFLTAVQAVIGAVFFFPFLLLPSTSLPSIFVPSAALAVLYLGVVITFGAYGLYNFGVSRIPASRAASFINLVPVFALILGIVVLGESLNTMQVLAGLMVFVGMGLSAGIRLPARYRNAADC